MKQMQQSTNKSSNSDVEVTSTDAIDDMNGIVTSTTPQSSHDPPNTANQRTYCGLDLASSDSDVIEIDDD